MLMSKCRVDCENSLDEAAALFRMRAVGDLSQKHAVPDALFGNVVGRLDAVDPDKCPKGRRDGENLGARARGFFMRAAATLLQQRLESLSKTTHVDSERC